MDLTQFCKRRALILAVVTCAVYAMTIGHGFVLDDPVVYTENDSVCRGFSGIPKLLVSDAFEGYLGEASTVVGGRYRPLSLVTFAIEYQFWERFAPLSHAVNVALYASCCVLLFYVLISVLGANRRQVAFWAAMLFALHPVHSEVVANIKGRDEILCMLFMLLALRTALSDAAGSETERLTTTGLFFVLAMLSKETGIVLIVLLPLALILCRRCLHLMPRLIAVLAGCALAYLAVRYCATAEARVAPSVLNNPFADSSLLTRWATAFYVLLRYLALLCFPHSLLFDYSFAQLELKGFGDWLVLISMLLHAGLLVVAVRRLRQRCWFAYGYLWYVLTLLPVANFVLPVGTFMAERFLFLPSAAFCALVAGLALSSRMQKLRAAVVPVLCIVCLLFAGRTLFRLPAWKSNYTLVKADWKRASRNARVQHMLGEQLMLRAKREAEPGNWLTGSEEAYRRSLAIYEDGWAYAGLGDCLRLQGRSEAALVAYEQGILLMPGHVRNYVGAGLAADDLEQYAAAIGFYLKADAIDREGADVCRVLGLLLHRVGRHAEAVPYLRIAVKQDPTFAEALRLLAGSLRAIGQPEEALALLEQAVRADPKRLRARVELGQALRAAQQHEAAVQCLLEALRLEPALVAARQELASVYLDQGNQDAAAREYQRILVDEPNHPVAHNNLGTFALDRREIQQAIDHFDRAIEANRRYVLPHNNRGNAYLLQKEYYEAIGSYRSAIELDPTYATGHMNLGRALLHIDDVATAEEHFRRYLQLRPNDADVKKILENIERFKARQQQPTD